MWSLVVSNKHKQHTVFNHACGVSGSKNRSSDRQRQHHCAGDVNMEPTAIKFAVSNKWLWHLDTFAAVCVHPAIVTVDD